MTTEPSFEHLRMFPNGSSRHTILTLATTDHDFSPSRAAKLEDIALATHELSGLNDIAFYGSTDLYAAIQEISKIPGILSSRTLLIADEHKAEDPQRADHSAVISIDAMLGHEEDAVAQLAELSDLHAVYTTRGVYGITAFATFDDERQLKRLINQVEHIRHAALFKTANPLQPVDIVRKPQEIDARHYNTRNKYEGDNYSHDTSVNESYAQGCISMAQQLNEIFTGSEIKPLVYAPLRGAKPMVDVMMDAFRRMQDGPIDVFEPLIQYPVTSSFVLYDPIHPYLTKKGRHPASGRSTNQLELERLKVKNPEVLARIVYVDEIISGGMLKGHTREMVQRSEDPRKNGSLVDEVDNGTTKVFVFGLQHAHGAKYGRRNRKSLNKMNAQDRIELSTFPIDDLVTEDQRFLLGAHYLMNHLGPHTIPFVDASRDYTRERKEFLADVKKVLRA